MTKPTSDRAECERLDATYIADLPNGTEYTAVVQEVYDKMGFEFGTQLEDAVLDLIYDEKRRALDQIVIGMVNECDCGVHEVWVTRRTEFRPVMKPSPYVESLITHSPATQPEFPEIARLYQAVADIEDKVSALNRSNRERHSVKQGKTS